jgi:hypothetical protein
MLSKAGQVDAIKWFHNEHLYNLTPKSFSYTTIEKKYDRDDMPLMLRLQATPPYGHWEFFKTSTGLWVAKIKVRVDNPLYSKNITCPEGQKCTWEVEQSREKTPLELNPELIKILIEEGLLSSKEYELLEGFCKYIEQRHTQEKLHELQSTFENKCSLKFQTLSPEDQQGLCVRIRNNFIPAFKNLEALTSVTE